MLEFNVDAAKFDGLFAFRQSSELDFIMPSERFYVELRPRETTIVSWKKLLKDHQNSACSFSSSKAPAASHPALEARNSSRVAKERDLLHPLRLCSVIERIERLYQGDNSDNELNNGTEDDRYDTQDSFIDDSELDNYFSVDNAKLKHHGFFVNRGKLEQEAEVVPSTIANTKTIKRSNMKKLNTGLHHVSKNSNSKNNVKAIVKLSNPSASFSSSFDINNFKGTEEREQPNLPICEKVKRHASIIPCKVNPVNGYFKGKSRCQVEGKKCVRIEASSKGKLDCKFKADRKEELHKLSQVNNPSKRGPIISLKHRELYAIDEQGKPLKTGILKGDFAIVKSLPHLSDENVSSPQSALERAILDLKHEVAEVCPPALVDHESEQVKRSRLPQAIKLKLAKVARLAVNQGANTDKLIKKLIGLLCHVVQLDKLKKHLKAMIEFSSSALKEKEDRLQGIKEEVAEMIKARVHQLPAENICPLEGIRTPSSCIKESRKNGVFQWDHALEDRICDLCEGYIEGLDENKGFHLRNLYAELIKLWPQGWMDIMGIKLAVHRAKERRKLSYEVKKTADAKKRRLLTAKQKLENPDDDGITILQLITKKSPYLGQKMRRLEISKREKVQEI